MDYEVCFTNGDVVFITEALFETGYIRGKHPITGKTLVAYIANMFYVLEIEDAKAELKARQC